MDVDITNGERLFIDTKELGEIYIKETPEGLTLTAGNASIMVLSQGNNGILLLNKDRIKDKK